MIARYKQLFIVIDPIWSEVGWEYDLELCIKNHLSDRKSVKQTVQTIIGQVELKEAFVNGTIKENAVLLMTEASSDLTILAKKLSKRYSIPIFSVGFWRSASIFEYTYTAIAEKQWWSDFDRVCFKALDKNILSDECFRYDFKKFVSKTKHSVNIFKYAIPAEAIKDRIDSIQPVEFKTDLILVDVPYHNTEIERMFSLITSEMRFDKPVSIVFAYEHGAPTREQYVQWLMNAKVVINFDVRGRIGDDVYQYYAANCVPLCNAPNFYTNIIPEEWRLESEWFTNIGTVIDALPMIKHKLGKALLEYDTLRPTLEQEENRLSTLFFSSKKCLQRLY